MLNIFKKSNVFNGITSSDENKKFSLYFINCNTISMITSLKQPLKSWVSLSGVADHHIGNS